MSLFWHQLRAEQLMFWRSREAAIFVFLFPPLLFVLLASVFGDGIEDGRRVSSYLVAGLIGYAVANTALGGLAITLVIRRESGLLKRLRSTPLPGSALPRRRAGLEPADRRAPVADGDRARRAPLRRRPAENVRCRFVLVLAIGGRLRSQASGLPPPR